MYKLSGEVIIVNKMVISIAIKNGYNLPDCRLLAHRYLNVYEQRWHLITL